MLHLWEVDHDYYCAQYNYYASPKETAHEYNSWSQFLDEFGGGDMIAYNLVFRWDWYNSDDPDHELEQDELRIFFMQQRKGKFVTAFVKVNKSDEDEVIEWLKPRRDYLLALWSPLIEQPVTS